MLKLFAKYGKDYKLSIILAPIFKIFEAIFGLIVPLVVKNIIDKGINESQGVNYIIQQGLILLGLAIVGFIMTMVCQMLAVKVSTAYAYSIRNDLYKKINTLSYKELDDFTPSSLQTRLSSDVIQTQNAFAMLLRLAIRAPFIIIGSVVMSIFVSPSLCWIFLVAGLLLGGVIMVIGFISIPYNSKIQSNLDTATNIVNDNLTGVRVVRAFNKQEHEKKRYYFTTATIQDISVRLAKISSLSNPLNTLIINAGLILILVFGSINVSNGSLTQGSIVSLTNYMTQISQTVVVVANLIVIFSKGSSSAKRIWEVLNSKSSLIEGEKEVDTNKEMVIDFKDVCFKYNKDASNSISNFNYQFKQGNVYGIIGGTGSGKSTLMNLLCHFYDVDEGEVSINNINIKEYKETSVIDNIGLVSQNPTLFSGTIDSNLRFGDKNASDENIKKAIEIGQSSNIIQAKGGLNSEINQGGKNLSGGQRQRLTISRALVKDPKIIILDDASSALDFETDYKLRKAIREISKDKLVILISQRVNSIKDADHILVLDKGELVGSGIHSTLINSCKVYKDFCISQEVL